MDIDREALLPVFASESEENIIALEESLLALEESPDDDEIVATIFRAAHTLKGNSESLGFDAIAACAHATESVLDALRQHTLAVTSGLVSLLLEAADALRAMLAIAAAGGEPSLTPHEEVVARLAAIEAGGIDPGPLDRAPQVKASPAGRAAPEARRKTLRVDLPTLDRIMTQAEELSIARARLHVALGHGAAGSDAWDAVLDADRSFDALRELVMRLRLVAIGPLFRSQVRSVRDLAQAHGKLARVVIEGHDVEVDTTIAEALRDPLTHMIRNAIDHALESPDARRARGKDPVGTITLRARHEAGRLKVEICDDGAGFRRDRILRRAIASGLVEGDGSHLREADIYALVFAAGFSTAEKVTDLSGRGVGMDVVARNIASLKGTIAITSAEGKGSVITLSVPLTLSIVDGFTVAAGDETYVIPLESVRECIDLPPGEERHEDACGVLNFRGEVLPYVRLRGLFALRGPPPARESVVVVEHEGQRAGLAVDALRGEKQAVVRPLAKMLRGLDAITGTTVLGDGRVALILDVPSLMREAVRRQTKATNGLARAS
jgi:two-component system chemotaxis sensor kinase CheA